MVSTFLLVGGAVKIVPLLLRHAQNRQKFLTLTLTSFLTVKVSIDSTFIEKSMKNLIVHLMV
jgi:hypothetical protein